MKGIQAIICLLMMWVISCAPGKLDGTVIRYGSVLRIRSSLTGHLY